MSSNWDEVSVALLEQERALLVQDGNHGEYRPRRNELVSSGTPHIRAADISDPGTIDFTGAQQINDIALQRIRKGVGAPGDILLTHKGTVGKLARAPFDAPHFVCSPQTTFWRSLAPERLDQTYLYAYMRSPKFAAQLKQRMHESDMAPYVSLTAQRHLLVLLPPIAVQRAIARVVSALDDKIRSEIHIADLLYRMSQELFDDVLRRAAASSIAPTPLSELVQINPRVRIAKGAEAPFVTMAAIEPWAVRTDRAIRRSFSGGSKFEFGDTLMARITGCIEHGKGMFNDFIDEPSAGSTEFYVLRAGQRLTPETTFLLTRREAVRRPLISRMMGSSGRQRVPIDAFSAVEVSVPESLADWRPEAAAISACFAKSRACWRHASTLGRLRDVLLPKLISAEIRVSNEYEAKPSVEAPVLASA